MSLVQDALGKLREVWDHVRWLDLLHLLDYTQWLGYGVGIDEQGAQIVIFCRTDTLPLALRFLVDDVGPLRYRLRVNGQGIDVRLIVTGGFVSLGGTPPAAAVSQQVGAGARVKASWQEGAIHPVNKTSRIGTIGAILRKTADQSLWLLSANHVIGINCKESNLNFQVKLTGNGTSEIIGTEVECIQMESGLLCPADAAVVRIDLPKERISTAHPSGLTSNTFFPVSSDMPPGTVVFKKAGGATGPQESLLVAVEATLVVDVDFRGNVQMSNQIVTEPLGDEGDSGTLAVEKNSGQPVGLMVAKTKSTHAGEERFTVVSPINSVFTALPGFSLVLPGDVL